MSRIMSRRALFAASGASLLTTPSILHAQQAKARLVVIGGGFGGATAARFARMNYPWMDVTMIEPQPKFITCPYSNLVLAGTRKLADITHSYDGLKQHGIKLIPDWVVAIDATKKTVKTRSGTVVTYDRLIVSPGISIKWDALEGYDEAAAQQMPHAWIQGDGAQTLLLRRQLEAMPDGGLVGLAIPANPFRCPPGPYERISMIADYLKKAKPKSKILALDAKDAFSKQGLFQDAWKALYGDMIEWVPLARDGKVVKVDAKEKLLISEFGVKHRVAVANVIPPQSAAKIALDAGLADASGWVPVNHKTFEAKSSPGIHVIGDACNGTPMPKSGYVASNTAKQAVASAAALLRGEAPPEAVYFNTCYSHVGPNYGISVVGIYRPTDTTIAEVPNSGGVSQRGDLPDLRKQESTNADAWYRSLTYDMFA